MLKGANKLPVQTRFWHLWHLGTCYILNLIKKEIINNTLNTRAREVPTSEPRGNGTEMQQILEVFVALGVAITTFMAPPVDEPVDEYAEEYYEETYEYDYDYDYYYEEPYYEGSYGVDEDFQFQGVREYDGRTETWYSSNVLYHQDTADWYVDDEGYYRDEDGYYVVAASDMEEGETFEGSKGECKVYDCGCADGVTDYYVNW